MQELNFEHIGQRLRQIRVNSEYTQEYIADKVGINTSHISNIENNRVKISLTTLVNICNTLHTTVDYVLASEYSSETHAIDNEILKELKNCDNEKKEKILKIIKIL